MIYTTVFIPQAVSPVVTRHPSVPRIGEVVQMKGQQLRALITRWVLEEEETSPSEAGQEA